MANETATKSKRFYCVSLLPDICKTPIGPSTPPIPYSVVGEFSQATNVSPNVKAHSELVILHNRSVIPTVKGDEPGKAGGIKSGTFAKKVETKTASKTYFANGTATVQEGCEVWMNDRNTVGKIYERGGAAPRTRLEQIVAMAQEKLDEATKQVKTELQPVAQAYKDKLSGTLHEAAADAIGKGGKVAAGGVALTATGAVATATGVGAPVGVPVAAAGAVTTAAGGAVTTVGAVVETGATLLDNVADYILTGKTPDLNAMAMGLGQRLLTSVVGNKVPGLNSVLQKGKQRTKPVTPRQSQPRPPDKTKGGKIKKKKDKKSDKPSDCCPKNKAPGGKPVSSRHPVHFGTGEEVLYQTDFVIDGPIPLPWTRCYRSGSELEDWGMCGARWGLPYTASIVTTGKGIIYVDDSGRPMLLPPIDLGAVFDNRKEGFALTHCSDTEYLLEWRDGSTERFVRCPSADSWLPHGFDGVNAMRPTSDPQFAERYVLSRSQGRDGQGITVERFPDAKFGQVLLRVRSDGGPVLEAMRYEPQSRQITQAKTPCIGHVDEVREDGIRICHASYEYDTESTKEQSHIDGDDALPARNNLVAQTNLAGHTRRYGYGHHLLTSYTTYSGFEHTLQWISLATLRERWGGNRTHTEAELVERYPITLENSYQARAVATDTSDGLDSVRIFYLDEDTTRVTDANGGVLEYEFDANWLAVDVRRIDTTGIVNSLGRRVWDKDGMLLDEIDAAGRATRYAYDSAGNLTVSTDALGRSNRIDYDGHNQPVAVTDPLGHLTRLEYDGNGNVTSQKDALGHITRYRYDKQSRVVAVTDARGGTKQIDYDRAGRMASYTDCSGYRTSFEYDQNGVLVAVIDALKGVTRYEYGPLGNMTKVCRADGAATHFEHDSEGRLIALTDAAGFKTRYTYNGHGMPVERIDALDSSIEYRYDALLQVVELINANGESYLFTYDVEGRLITDVGFDGKATNYIYDAHGQLTATECAGNRIELLRDPAGQLIAKQTADGIYRFVYDSLGRLTVAVAPNARNDFAYDALGQVIGEYSAYFLTQVDRDLIGPPEPDAQFVMTHSYDELGNRIQTIMPNGQTLDLLRYGSGHWHGSLWDGQTIVDIERDALHRERTRTLGPTRKLTAARKYDSSSRIARMRLYRADVVGEQALHDQILKYDATGNLLDVQLGPSNGTSVVNNQKYMYDPLGRLLAANQAAITETFHYNRVGDLVDPGLLLSASPGSDLRLTPPIVRARTLRYAGRNYTYDAHGNLTCKRYIGEKSASPEGGLHFSYDAENRLIKATGLPNRLYKESKYFYDSFSRRIAKALCKPAPANSNPSDSLETSTNEVIIFVWDGDSLIHEHFSSGRTFTYLYEPDTFTPLAQIEGQEGQQNQSRGKAEIAVNHYFCDHLGTPQGLIAESGTLAWVASHSAWGKALKISPTFDDPVAAIHQPIRFQGQYEDEETLLHYNRYRYYDPESARYITLDPIGLAGGLNEYAYAPNPTGWTDPRGLKKTCAPNQPCNPCDGRDPAAEASQFQGQGDYPGHDIFKNFVLRKGTIIYSLYPGKPPGFGVTNHTLKKANGSAKKYHELTQVKSSGFPAGLSLRTKVSVYRLEEDLCVGKSVARANPQFGKGGATQYYISTMDIGKIKAGIQRSI